MATGEKARRGWRSPWVLCAGGAVLAVVAALAGSLMAVLGAELACVGGSGGSAVAAPATQAAKRDIPPGRLRLYQQAGQRFDLDWTFLASIGTQECGSGTCAEVNSSGCGGPMQIAIVRESACSPGPGPTIWETYGVDADGDGHTNPFDLADSIFTAAKLLRRVMGAPPTGGSYAAYRQAACNYYGACADAAANYADEVMARAVEYGFHGAGSPAPSDPGGAEPATAEGSSCGGSSLPSGSGPMGPVRKASAPQHLATLPASVSAAPGIECDARIVADVVYLARRFGILVTACYGTGHEPTGEHPLGAAIDAAPRDGDWSRTMRLALAIGWRPACAASGVAPECAHPPFRFIGYNGYPDHGDPLHCVPCGGGPHLHISWLTSASPGEPENRARYGYEPASWIEVFDATPTSAESARSGGGEGR
jgi:hypothetical protein